MLFNIILGLVSLDIISKLVPVTKSMSKLAIKVLLESLEQVNLLKCAPIVLENGELQLIDDVVASWPFLQSGKTGNTVYIILGKDKSEWSCIPLAYDAVIFFSRLHDRLG